jgi:membrane dipeptidase
VKTIGILAAACLCALCGCSERSRAAGPRRILIDTHNDVPLQTVKGVDLAQRRSSGHTDIPRLKEGGVGAVFFAAYVSPEYAKKGGATRRALQMIDSIRHDIAAAHPNDMMLATSAADIERAAAAGRIAALIGVEGGHAIEDDLRVLRTFYDLGARYMTLTHVNTNNWADSSGDITDSKVKRHGGLTDFGRQVVREMNRLGMMVDVSHVSDETFRDVLATSQAPPIASHSSCRALAHMPALPRNLTDGMIRDLARKGGVMQINFSCEFLSQKSADAAWWTKPEVVARIAKLPAAEQDKAEEELNAKVPRATLDDVVAHIDHVVKLVGADYVGIGSDFDGIGCSPAGLDDVSKFPNLVRALERKGYSEQDLRKILGGNLLRVMRAAEKQAGH